MSPTRNNWQDKIKQRNSALRSPTEQAVFPMGNPSATPSDDEQNSKNANQQIFVDAKKQDSKIAEEQNFALAKEQTSATTEKQTPVDAEEQISKNANQQKSKTAKEQNGKGDNLRRITFHIPEELFKQLKLVAVEEDMTMLEIGAEMARDYIRKRKG